MKGKFPKYKVGDICKVDAVKVVGRGIYDIIVDAEIEEIYDKYAGWYYKIKWTIEEKTFWGKIKKVECGKTVPEWELMTAYKENW